MPCNGNVRYDEPSCGIFFKTFKQTAEEDSPHVQVILPSFIPVGGDGCGVTHVGESSPLPVTVVGVGGGIEATGNMPVTSAIYDYLQDEVLIPKRFTADTSSDGNLIAAVTGKIIRILSMSVTASSGSGVVTMYDDSVFGTARFRVRISSGDAGRVFNFTPAGWFQSGTGSSVYTVNLTTGVLAINGTYIEVTP